MATPTLTNHNTAEQYQSTTLDLTDMVVRGTGSIIVLLAIDIAAGTLDYLPGSSGNLVLDDLGLGQYRLQGTAAELSASLANLGFISTADYFDTFTLQVAATNDEGGVSGNKILSYALSDGDAISLADGVDHLFLLTDLVGSASVEGGNGSDTMLVLGASPLTIDFSQAGQQVTSGSSNVTYTGFENLDASAASAGVIVTLAASTTSIRTGTAADNISFRNVAAVVNAGAGSDTLVLDPAQLSDLAASTAMTINLAVADANQITSGASLGASWQTAFGGACRATCSRTGRPRPPSPASSPSRWPSISPR